ncbi:efflux RND transporter periplasmic adaptor subunit [Chitinimonas lacunae]|uniref:Efflux RND transporter periplasmic adaptor subunit n=1 Tax=Chitinimonas lacunae TaxID=1963018 RepID=A0ABV8MLC2_9NEIS
MSPALDRLAIDRQALPRRRSKKPLFIVLALLAVAAVVAIGRTGRPIPVETVRVVQAWPSAGLSQLTATGYVVAQKKAAVASKATGRLEWLGVREGSAVKAGETLARLESADLAAQVAQAVANVEAARARLKQAEAEAIEAGRALRRSRELLAQGFLSAAAHDNAISRDAQARALIAAQQAAVRQAEALVTAARVALDNTVIRAPFAGVVLTKNADVGDVISPFNASADSKGAVITLADMATLEVEADVSETSLFKARLEQPCEIQLDALPELRLLGQVRSIVPSVDRAKATITFKIGFSERDPRVLPQMSAKVNFLERPLKADERRPRIAINPKTVQDSAVFVVENGIARRQPVELGAKLGDLVEVRRGLRLDQAIVLSPGELKDGAAVTEKKA